MTPSPFEILGLPRTFDLDPNAIEAAYLPLAARAHPDLLGDDAALALSERLNEARRILEDPESRADLLLNLLGGPTREADRSLDPGFLQEQMDERERIEEVLAAGDPAAIDAEIARGRARREQFIERVRGQFSAGLPSESARRDLRRTLNAWRYTERLLEQLSASRG